jgi:hypothetical protein
MSNLQWLGLWIKEVYFIFWFIKFKLIFKIIFIWKYIKLFFLIFYINILKLLKNTKNKYQFNTFSCQIYF